MTSILYEHPLNERMRNYLKIEQLFAQTADCLRHSMIISHNLFFSSLFSIIDSLERNDIRGDIVKDLEKLEQNLVIWSQIPTVDDAVLSENLTKTIALSSQLKKISPQWLALKEDKFLTGIKQRFAIQGGNSLFDLPQLKLWLNQDTEIIKNQCQKWLTHIQQVNEAIVLILTFVRQQAQFESIDTESGFYQDNGEGLKLLRIKVPKGFNGYPTISGNRYRYSIRFMSPCVESGRKYSKQAIQFQLARC